MDTKFRTIDGSDLSALTFGTMQFGGNADASASRAMYDAAREAGINHFDTAVGYTGGASETLLGPLVAAERDAIYLATKVAYQGGAGSKNITTMFDQCRKQLKLDHVDLLYLHRFDDDTPLEETFTTMAEMQQAGLFSHIGVSNYSAWQVMKAQAVAKSLGHESRPSPIISARSVEQLKPSLMAANFQMTDTLYENLTSLTPTPPPATDRLEET